jgi:hypothetical protein
MSFQPLPHDHPLLAGQPAPEMMAIGDSLYNGTRSLTTEGRLAELAPPAMVARGLGLPFRTPNYPRPVLADFEAEMRKGIDLGRIRAAILENARRWIETAPGWSPHPFFDNIGIAGASYADLHTVTAGGHREKIFGLVQDIRESSGINFAAIVKLYFAINITFLLNPSGEPDVDDLTPLEQVASRGPKRLLVNIGSNEGLFRLGLMARFDRDIAKDLSDIPGKARALAEALTTHCRATKRVYFNLLIRPRVLANLAPRADADITFPGDPYYERYVGRLGGMGGISAGQMREADDTIRAINDQTVREMTDVFTAAGTGQDIRFIDFYEIGSRFDGKHYGNQRMVEITIGQHFRRLSNLPFQSNLFGFQKGGLFSLDNLHPSTVGYSILANAVGDAVAGAEAIPYQSIDPTRAYLDDTLLRDPPRTYDFSVNLASLAIGLARLFGVKV